MVPNVGTKGCHGKELPVSRPCDPETYGSQPGNQRLLLQGIAGSQKLEFMFSKLSGYHCKELRGPKA